MAKGPVDPAARHQGHQQTAGPQGFTAALQHRKRDGDRGGHQRPGQKAPMQKAHRQGWINGGFGAAAHPFEIGSRRLEMKQRFSGRPKHAAACQQRADQHGAPIKQFEAWLGLRSAQLEPPHRADGQSRCQQKQHSHHPLPGAAEPIADDGLAAFGESGGQLEIHRGHHQKHQQGAGAHPQRRLFQPVTIRFGRHHALGSSRTDQRWGLSPWPGGPGRCQSGART